MSLASGTGKKHVSMLDGALFTTRECNSEKRVPNLSALNEGDESCHRIIVYGFVLSIESQGVTLFTEKKTRSVLVKRNRK